MDAIHILTIRDLDLLHSKLDAILAKLELSGRAGVTVTTPTVTIPPGTTPGEVYGASDTTVRKIQAMIEKKIDTAMAAAPQLGADTPDVLVALFQQYKAKTSMAEAKALLASVANGAQTLKAVPAESLTVVCNAVRSAMVGK